MTTISSHKVFLRNDIVSENEIKLFHDKVNINFISGCWEWTGARSRTTRKGNDEYYGYAKMLGKWMSAHRASWILHIGFIPKNMNVCHKCDNTICCNPEHLFLGTDKDNVQDKIRKGRQNIPRGSKNKLSKLSEKDVLKIREMIERGTKITHIAKEYGVSVGCIDGIKKGNNWKWLK